MAHVSLPLHKLERPLQWQCIHIDIHENWLVQWPATWPQTSMAFDHSNTGIVGSNPLWDVGVVYIYLYVVLCRQSTTGWSPAQGVFLRDVWQVKMQTKNKNYDYRNVCYWSIRRNGTGNVFTDRKLQARNFSTRKHTLDALQKQRTVPACYHPPRPTNSTTCCFWGSQGFVFCYIGCFASKPYHFLVYLATLCQVCKLQNVERYENAWGPQEIRTTWHHSWCSAETWILWFH